MYAVEAVDIVKTFGDVRALDGVTVRFEPGIVYGFLGPNGAGKTTLIRVLTTLLKPDSGSATSPKWTAAVVASDTTNALNVTSAGIARSNASIRHHA